MNPLKIPEIARELLEYDPATGEIRWVEFRNGNALKGALAGGLDNGRIRIAFAGKHFLAHRVAYFLHTGEQPPRFLDHKDGDASNNRFSNLRPASRRQNNQNRKLHSNNSTGYRGVTLCERGKFRARVGVDGRKKTLGRFDTAEEASAVYEEYSRKHFGEFYRPL